MECQEKKPLYWGNTNKLEKREKVERRRGGVERS